MDQVIVSSRMAVTCRELTIADFDAVTALLTRGFAAWRDAAFWTRALGRLADRSAPAGLPQFGYVLEVSGTVVGVLLLVASEWLQNGKPVRRCNVSSWYVEPEFRVYGTLLAHQALRHRDVTYLNVTPAPETWKLLLAQGYQPYAAGRMVMLPLLARGGERVRVYTADRALTAGPDLGSVEIDLLREHARWDCLSLICETGAGRVPFVFGRRRRRGVLPFGYLIYCRGFDSLCAYARPLGRALARRGMSMIVADADGEVAGIPGWFKPGHPKFYRGAVAPHPSDLAYTERAIFGA